MKNYFGKYRGRVVAIDDDTRTGQLEVLVPDVLGEVTRWAMPCVPCSEFSGAEAAIPPVGANVWVEFEAGNPAFPIWSGFFWNRGEAP